MQNIESILDVQNLSESEQVEYKLAAGKDGKGSLPKDFWPTYSAMANTRGGWIVLGVEEKKSKFQVVGVCNPEKIKRDLYNQLSDRDKVSCNVINNALHVKIIDHNNNSILAVYVRPATRSEKPIFLNKQPYLGTFRRVYDGDRKCTSEEVDRMFAERVTDSRDQILLQKHFNFANDINFDSLKAYRNLLSAHNSEHPYVSLDLFDLFKMIGGWRIDRETGEEGLTLAGVLMFGNWSSIRDAAPNYFVDYQERPEARTEARWIDRVVPDGTWTGNLFDFYRKVYAKLTSDLKIPFHLEEGQRKSQTPIHTAIREALVNCIVHADYSERVSVLVVKRPDMFGFRNPGLSRIPIAEVLKGGLSDCRNRILHQMFLVVGLGERAGSGMPKIFSGWKSANWRPPKLWEKEEPAQTLLELSTASLIPSDVRDALKLYFDDRFEQLSEFEQLIVATAYSEGWINHERACQLTTKHSRDVTLTLPKLESKGFLQSTGEQRQKTYTIIGGEIINPDDVFPQTRVGTRAESDANKGSNSPNKGSSSLDNESSLDINNRDEFGRFIVKELKLPVIDDLARLKHDFRESLISLADDARNRRRLEKDRMEEIIAALCDGQYISGAALSEILGRKQEALRQQHLKRMVDNSILALAFPQFRNHPKQAYIKLSKI